MLKQDGAPMEGECLADVKSEVFPEIAQQMLQLTSSFTVRFWLFLNASGLSFAG